MTAKLDDFLDLSRRDEGCWPWAGRLGTTGYGRIGVRAAHRAVYEKLVGPIPAGLFVCHRCDNPPCVNPAHLFLGTNKDNMQDCREKGRFVGPPHHRGAAHVNAALTQADVDAIRAALTGRFGEQHQLALRYGVSDSTISDIAHRKTYR